MSNDENDSMKLLAAIQDKEGTDIILPEISDKDLVEYVKEQLRETYVKPRRISGRPLLSRDEFEKEFKAPTGVFNLGTNAVFTREIKEEDKIDEDEEIIVQNNVKMVDGKMVFTEEDQGTVDAAEEAYLFNQSVKNDIPYQMYMKIREFGRLTVEELQEMYKALDKRMFKIIVKDMIHKRYLKIVKEIDRDIEFKDIPNCNDPQEYMNQCIVEKEIETLEIVGESERRQVLEEKEENQKS